MRYIIGPIFSPLILLAWRLVISGVTIQQNIYRRDIERNGCFTDIIENYFSRIVHFIGSRRVYKAIACTPIIAAIFILPTISVDSGELYKSNAGAQQSKETGVVRAEEVPDMASEPEVIEDAEEDADTEDKTDKEKKSSTVWKEIPLCDKVSATKSYMDDVKISNTSSKQWALFNKDAYGEVITDDLGFQYIEGIDPDTGEEMKFYTVALGTYYQDHIGQKFRITMENGFVFGAITGDFKSDKHTNEGSESAELYEVMTDEEVKQNNPYRCLAGSKDMIEFIIDAEVAFENFPAKNGYVNSGSLNENFDSEHRFKGLIAKIEVMDE